MTDWLTDWLTVWHVDWLTDRQRTDWLMAGSLFDLLAQRAGWHTGEVENDLWSREIVGFIKLESFDKELPLKYWLTD